MMGTGWHPDGGLHLPNTVLSVAFLISGRKARPKCCVFNPVRPRGTETREQFRRDSVHRVNRPGLTERLEPGQLARVLADYLFGDSLVLFVLKKNINAGLDSAVFLLGLYLGHAS